jgi:hypothetical protein
MFATEVNEYALSIVGAAAQLPAKVSGMLPTLSGPVVQTNVPGPVPNKLFARSRYTEYVAVDPGAELMIPSMLARKLALPDPEKFVSDSAIVKLTAPVETIMLFRCSCGSAVLPIIGLEVPVPTFKTTLPKLFVKRTAPAWAERSADALSATVNVLTPSET